MSRIRAQRIFLCLNLNSFYAEEELKRFVAVVLFSSLQLILEMINSLKMEPKLGLDFYCSTKLVMTKWVTHTELEMVSTSGGLPCKHSLPMTRVVLSSNFTILARAHPNYFELTPLCPLRPRRMLLYACYCLRQHS